MLSSHQLSLTSRRGSLDKKDFGATMSTMTDPCARHLQCVRSGSAEAQDFRAVSVQLRPAAAVMRTEAMSIADTIAVMKDAELQQLGSAREIYEKPANRFVVDFIGRANFLPGRIAGRTETRVSIALAGITIELQANGVVVDRRAVGCGRTGRRFLLANRMRKLLQSCRI